MGLALKTLLIDDHALFRQGMKYLLAELNNRIEFSEANNCKMALEHYAKDTFDLILLDYHIPGEVVVDQIGKLKEVFISSAIVIVSSEENPFIMREAIEGGATGFIPKSSTQSVLVAALRLVVAAETYLPSNALSNINNNVCVSSAVSCELASNPIEQLSCRQREVLRSAVKGNVNKTIAREMDISESTVKAHLSSIFRALGVNNRTQAVYVAAKLGLVP